MRCDLSFRIEPMLERGEVDLAIITRDPARPIGEFLRNEPRVWCAARDHRPELVDPLPLAMFPEAAAAARPHWLRSTPWAAPGASPILEPPARRLFRRQCRAGGDGARHLLGAGNLAPPRPRRRLPELPDLDIALVLPRGATTATKHLANFIRDAVVDGQIAA